MLMNLIFMRDFFLLKTFVYNFFHVYTKRKQNNFFFCIMNEMLLCVECCIGNNYKFLINYID